MKTMRTMMAVAAFALATGCATQVTPTQANLALAGHSPTVPECTVLLEQYVRMPGRFFDPDAVKDVAVGQPTLWKVPIAGRGPVWIVPFTFNAKNRFGGYVGIQQWQLYVSNGQIDVGAQDAYDNLRAFQRGVEESLNQ